MLRLIVELIAAFIAYLIVTTAALFVGWAPLALVFAGIFVQRSLVVAFYAFVAFGLVCCAAIIALVTVIVEQSQSEVVVERS